VFIVRINFTIIASFDFLFCNLPRHLERERESLALALRSKSLLTSLTASNRNVAAASRMRKQTCDSVWVMNFAAGQRSARDTWTRKQCEQEAKVIRRRRHWIQSPSLRGSGSPKSVHPNQHLDPFSRFCTVKPSWAAWQTDRQTDDRYRSHR